MADQKKNWLFFPFVESRNNKTLINQSGEALKISIKPGGRLKDCGWKFDKISENFLILPPCYVKF